MEYWETIGLNEKVWNQLSYTTRRKASDLIDKKLKLDRSTSEATIPKVGTLILAVPVFPNIGKYLQALFGTFFPFTNQIRLNNWELILIGGAATCCVTWYAMLRNLSKLKKEGEEIRQNLMKSLGKNFCTCKSNCTCEDEFIMAMECFGVNLIFENRKF